jgi:transposase
MIWVGDDWAEDHHDVEVLGDDGRRLARARLPEGLDGITRLHALIAEHMPASWADLEPVEAAGRVRIGIETDRGTWVQALLAAGYQVWAINPMSVARYRERHSTSGAKSDAGTPMCSPRSSAWTTPITARSPATAPSPKR